jgi:uncharacterized protein YbjT (DUF2867 family)
MTGDLIAVTGSTGQIGGRVARRLATAGIPQRLIVRDPARAPVLPGAETVAASYEDRDAMRRALAGVGTLLLVSATETAGRVALHTAAVDSALDAGVSRIVYVSFLSAAPDATFTFARDHWHTEEHIRQSGAAFTVLRDNLYIDVLPLFAGEDGVIRGPAGDGRVGAVSREDVADVAAAVLRDPGHNGATYDVTGPESLTLTEVAAQITQVTGRKTTYHAETLEEAYASRAVYGAPDWEVAGWVTSYAAIATGELDVVTDTVETVTGHKPQSLRSFLSSQPS